MCNSNGERHKTHDKTNFLLWLQALIARYKPLLMTVMIFLTQNGISNVSGIFNCLLGYYQRERQKTDRQIDTQRQEQSPRLKLRGKSTKEDQSETKSKEKNIGEKHTVET